MGSVAGIPDMRQWNFPTSDSVWGGAPKEAGVGVVGAEEPGQHGDRTQGPSLDGEGVLGGHRNKQGLWRGGA